MQTIESKGNSKRERESLASAKKAYAKIFKNARLKNFTFYEDDSEEAKLAKISSLKDAQS